MIRGRFQPWTEWIDLLALAALFCALTITSWGAWPDVLVDFGRELYVAWRVSAGDVLYRDVASFYGPLSPYVNGLLFRVGGVGLRTLVIANLALLAATTLMLRGLLRRGGTGRTAAAVACGAFLALFGFGHLIANGSFNFVCPYAHEATHGFALALTALLFALRWADPRRPPAWAWLAAAGAACGLAFLTKPVPFVAAAGWSAGLDRPLDHLAALARATAVQAAVLVPPAGLAFALRARPRAARWLAVGAAALLGAVLATQWDSRAWLRAARPLPLWAAGIAVASGVALWRARSGQGASALLARTGLAALALLLLSRVLFNARSYHYGFVLSAVATPLVIAALLDWIPRGLEERGAAGAPVRAVAAVAVAFVAASPLRDSHAFMARKEVTVGAGADAFRADARGAFVNAVVENVPRASGEGALVVLPEGVMINYLLRRPSSIPYVTMLPSDEAQFGEDEMLGSLRRRPPALIGLVHRTAEEFGAPLFGRDYAERTMDWIDAHYAPAFTVGDPPLEPGSAFGVRVLVRRAGIEAP